MITFVRNVQNRQIYEDGKWSMVAGGWGAGSGRKWGVMEMTTCSKIECGDSCLTLKIPRPKL